MTTGGQDVEGGSARRRELLHKTFDYVTERGVSDLSLRPLAAEIGTSPRVLLYLFGSKEGLLREVLALARQVELDAIARIAEQPGAGVDIRGLWDWLSAEEHRPILRLFTEAYARSLHDTEPWQGFAATSVSQWLDILRPLCPSAVDDRDREVWATLTLAVVRGLFLDLEAVGDTERVTAAFTRYLDMVGL